ncbi:related to fluconazole resistance protein [Rhynchosporium secalis]|uniref:Related to fluconazole resistance protein n=1 Tax=Rhynchosporium secalis TaxID=38038 RepID=A0A1E1MRW1_RHYSE|nr:related to fluconazole resistance protein [Rhynchosporium secalis]
MVASTEPQSLDIDKEKGLQTSWDSISAPETAVNTAAPSCSPSVHNESTSSVQDVDLEAGQNEKPTPAPASGVDAATNIVNWDGPNDPENPMNFPRSKKWTITLVTALMTFCVSFASSVFSTATEVTAKKWDVSLEVMILGVSLYVLGFACGPLAWGPLSEVYGRTQPLFLGFFLFTIFQIPVATAPNVATIMISRFLGGCFGAAPIAIVGGTYVDFWDTLDRGIATAAFAGATFIGPIAGPIVGEFITQSYLGWRWTAWITLIMSAFFGILGLFTVPETYAPILLKRKAERMRHETGNWALHSLIDEQPVNAKALLEKYFMKPWVMLFREPILMAMTLYSSLVYSILYLIFFAYPYSFRVVRGWSPTIASLPFLGIFIGIVICCVYIAIDTKTRFNKLLLASTKPFIPEARLPPMIIGSVMLPIGLFWFAWTSNPDLHWAPQVVSGIFIGCGIFLVFLPSQIYIVDTYLLNANSALAASSCVRALMAAGFPLFATYMYQDMGVDWATSLLGFLCLAMMPFPVLFWQYGEKLRMKGRFAFAL